MRQRKLILIILISLFIAGNAQAEEKPDRETHAEKVKRMEDEFWAASKTGGTVTGILVEGNSLFNGTTSPQNRSYDKPYTDKEILAAKISAERNSKIFLLTKTGELYYPTPKKGQSISESSNSPRIPRVLTEQQKKQGLFTWATLVPLVGREVEAYGEIYPGYAGVKGIHIKSIRFEGEYIVGE